MSRLAERVSPEIVAGLLSVTVIAMLIGIRGPGTPVAGPGPSESPRPSVAPTPSDGLSSAVRSALQTVVLINQRLADAGRDLETELDRSQPRAPEIAVVLPRIVTQTTAIGQQVTVLVADPTTASLGAELVTRYATLADLVRAALRESVQNQAAYVEAAKTSARLIRELAPLTARAQALLRGASASPAPSRAPSPAASPPRPSGPASPPPSRGPSSPTPAASAVDGGLIVNGGFETGSKPWTLQVTPGAVAALTIDDRDPGAGAAAARVDLATGSDARSGISLVQPGIALRAGQSYTVRLLVRAAEARDVRVRLSATNGDTYVARILPATTTWSTVSFSFDSLVDDPAAELGIDLGQSAATTWIDGVSVTPTG
jgi:hypothetical protein